MIVVFKQLIYMMYFRYHLGLLNQNKFIITTFYCRVRSFIRIICVIYMKLLLYAI